MKFYDQQVAQHNNQNRGIDFFFFGENNKCQQIGNVYLEFDVTLTGNGGNSHVTVDGNVDEPIRLVKIAFAYVFRRATPFTTGDEEGAQSREVGHISTIMRLLTNEHGDLLSYFDKSGETQNGIKSSPINLKNVQNHEKVDRSEKIKCH